LAAFGAAVVSAPSAGAAACAPVDVIAARGTGEPQSGSFILGGVTSAIAQQTGGSVYQVRYPATTDYVNGPNQGATDALAHLQAQAAACPQQKFVLAGYSEGAMVITVLMGRIPAGLQPRVAAAVLYGNPYFKSSSPASAGSGKGAANGLVPGLGVPAGFTGRTRDYCNAGDPVCGAGGNFAAHIQYAQYNGDATAFAVAKVRQAPGAVTPAPGPAPSPSTTAPVRPGAPRAVVVTPKFTG
jgi:hypothetical protein